MDKWQLFVLAVILFITGHIAFSSNSTPFEAGAGLILAVISFVVLSFGLKNNFKKYKEDYNK